VNIDKVHFSLFGYRFVYGGGSSSPTMAINNQVHPHTFEASEKWAIDYVARKNAELHTPKTVTPATQSDLTTRCVLVRHMPWVSQDQGRGSSRVMLLEDMREAFEVTL
jgi:hypothetical protein